MAGRDCDEGIEDGVTGRCTGVGVGVAEGEGGKGGITWAATESKEEAGGGV